MRELDYKVQLFFKYLPQVPKEGSLGYHCQLAPERLFINLMEFYDILAVEAPGTVLDFELLCYQKLASNVTTTTPLITSNRSFHLSE